MKWLKRTVALLTLLLTGPAFVMIGGNVLGSDWRTASRESAKIAPDPAAFKGAIVQVYGARAFSWRGAFGVHTWIATKHSNANHYRIYQVIGWRARYGGNAVAIQYDTPDRHWFGSPPELLSDLRGEGVDDIIRRIDKAARNYPYQNTYTLWPGPNSNTFTAWVAREVPELKLDLPPTAIGKDYLGDSIVAGAPSGTGYQVSLKGLVGVLAGIEEGLEVNLAGLTFGIDPKSLAIKLPGIGRIGVFPPVSKPLSLLKPES